MVSVFLNLPRPGLHPYVLDKNAYCRAGEMAWRLRTFGSCRGPEFDPCTHSEQVTTACNCASRGSQCPLWPLQAQTPSCKYFWFFFFFKERFCYSAAIEWRVSSMPARSSWLLICSSVLSQGCSATSCIYPLVLKSLPPDHYSCIIYFFPYFVL